MNGKSVFGLFLSFSSFFISSISAFGQISNPSFESPVVTGNFITINSSTVASGFNTPSTWRVLSGSIDIVKTGPGGYWAAPAAQGSNVLDLAGSAPSIIEQTFNTGTLTSFPLNFNYSRNLDFTGNASFSAVVRLYSGSVNYLNTTITRNSASDGASTSTFNWSTFSQNIPVPVNTNVTLRFEQVTQPSNAQGIIIDNFSPVPEPMSVMCVSMACLSCTLFARNKFNKVKRNMVS